jgi:hypothetical protein
MIWDTNSSGLVHCSLWRLLVAFLMLQYVAGSKRTYNDDASSHNGRYTRVVEPPGSVGAMMRSWTRQLISESLPPYLGETTQLETDDMKIYPTKDVDFWLPFKYPVFIQREFSTADVSTTTFEKEYDTTRTDNSEISSRSPPPEKRRLPLFENGGVMFFVHVPKAGGTTIRRNLQRQEKVVYHFGRNKTMFTKAIPVIEDALIHGTNNGTIHVLELHALDSPSLLQMRQTVLDWRTTAHQNKVDVFFFTVLREPVAYSVSHFNFFHVQKRNDSFEQCNATEENFLRLSLENPQCQFLYQGERSMRWQKRLQRSVLPQTCLTLVYETLLATMDWVGTTEQLTNATWPLLARMVRVPPSFRYKSHRVTRKLRHKATLLKQHNLTATAIQTIHKTSVLDKNIYDRIQKDFPISIWT